MEVRFIKYDLFALWAKRVSNNGPQLFIISYGFLDSQFLLGFPVKISPSARSERVDK